MKKTFWAAFIILFMTVTVYPETGKDKNVDIKEFIKDSKVYLTFEDISYSELYITGTFNHWEKPGIKMIKTGNTWHTAINYEDNIYYKIYDPANNIFINNDEMFHINASLEKSPLYKKDYRYDLNYSVTSLAMNIFFYIFPVTNLLGLQYYVFESGRTFMYAGFSMIPFISYPYSLIYTCSLAASVVTLTAGGYKYFNDTDNKTNRNLFICSAVFGLAAYLMNVICGIGITIFDSGTAIYEHNFYIKYNNILRSITLDFDNKNITAGYCIKL